MKQYRARRSAEVTPRYFVDRFPMFVDRMSSPPVVTFTYVDAGAVTLEAFGTHLRHISDYSRRSQGWRALSVTPPPVVAPFGVLLVSPPPVARPAEQGGLRNTQQTDRKTGKVRPTTGGLSPVAA